MKRYILLASVVAFMSNPPSTASAQMAEALGKPLSVSTLSAGTVTVRLIAGSPDKPLVGINVQLVAADGKAITARTDGEGRARFTKLSPGTQYIVKAEEAADEGAEPKRAESELFTIPKSGGIRLIMSTRGWQSGGAAAAPSVPTGAPMMDPRRMSGIPRGDGAEPPRQMTIAAVTGAVTNRIPNHPVHLIGYAADGTIARETKLTGEDGRASFSGLQPRTHAYYAMSTFTRKDGKTTDRILSDPISLPPRVGIRMLLAGLPEESTQPPVEDLSLLTKQSDRVRPGEVLAQFYFRDPAQAPTDVGLYEIPDGGKPPVEVARLPIVPATPADVTAEFSTPVALPNQAVGSVSIALATFGQPGSKNTPVPGVTAVLEPVIQAPTATPEAPGVDPAKDASADSVQPTPRVTDGQGIATFSGATVGKSYRVVLSIANKRLQSAPFVVPAAGGITLQASLGMRYESSAEALFTGVAADKIYYLEARYANRTQRTRPFQSILDRGVVLGFPPYAKPLLLFRFSGWTDDKFMGFQGQISLHNTDPMPWDPGSNGLAIPLPSGFIGGRVDDQVADMVKVEPGKGLIWRDLIAPGRRPFVMGFSLPIENGGAEFSMELPLGVLQGNIILMKTAGMRVENLTKGLSAAPRTARDGRDIIEISQIRFPMGGRLKFSLTGLPQASASERYTRNLVGAAVILLIGWTLFQLFAFRRRQAAIGDVETGDGTSDASSLDKLVERRESLLEQLVELESKKRHKQTSGDAYKRSRDKLQRRLEAVYTDIEKLERESGQPAN